MTSKRPDDESLSADTLLAVLLRVAEDDPEVWETFLDGVREAVRDEAPMNEAIANALAPQNDETGAPDG